MSKKLLVVFLLVAGLLLSASYAQKLTPQTIKKTKAEIVKLQDEVSRLKTKLKTAKTKQLKTDILDKIDLDQARIAKLKKLIYPKPAAKKRLTRAATVEAISTLEAIGPEETVSTESGRERRKIGIRTEIGVVGGFFAGTTGLLGEVRVPLNVILGPAATALRASGGLAQTISTDRRFVPLNLDLIFNFPPGWFSGVENYVGAGLNYVVLTTGQKQGTVGGELFYGIQSEGFGGIVFGEMGFGILRTGFSPSSKGVTIMVGFREPMGF
ncbi:MAG: hypothetical protein PHG97_05415 [Candidatus Margulisbacteria bacterium]|nr:hypothetical protein [Candidatus Margulisiibacteriota bacterium]